MHHALKVSESSVALFRSYHGVFAWRTEKDEQLIASFTEYRLQLAGIWRGKHIGVAIGSIPCLQEFIIFFHLVGSLGNERILQKGTNAFLLTV